MFSIPAQQSFFPQAYPVLNSLVGMLNALTNNVRIVGHTDTTPSADLRYSSNFDLSVARAMVVSQYLIERGVDPSRITISGRGEYDPIFPNDTDDHRILNSRVEIIIIYPDTSSSFSIN